MICSAPCKAERVCVAQVITLDMGLLVAGTKYRGEFEERLKKLMEEIKQNDEIILVRPCSPCCVDGRCVGLHCRPSHNVALFLHQQFSSACVADE